MTDMGFRPLTPTEQRIQAANGGRAVAEVLHDLYHDQRLTQDQMADRLGVARSTVIDLMQRWNVPTGYNRSSEAVA